MAACVQGVTCLALFSLCIRSSLLVRNGLTIYFTNENTTAVTAINCCITYVHTRRKRSRPPMPRGGGGKHFPRLAAPPPHRRRRA